MPAGQVLKIPFGLSLLEAAAVPEVFATAYLNLYQEANLARGETGAAARRRQRRGHRRHSTLPREPQPRLRHGWRRRQAQSLLRPRRCGRADRHKERFADLVQDWTEGRGFDVILDPVGGAYLNDNLASLRMDGRLVLIGLMGGVKAEIPLATVLMKRLRLLAPPCAPVAFLPSQRCWTGLRPMSGRNSPAAPSNPSSRPPSPCRKRNAPTNWWRATKPSARCCFSGDPQHRPPLSGPSSAMQPNGPDGG